MGSYDSEIRWWNARAASFDAKRAALRPLSFDHLSGAYKYAGNQNGAWTFDSSSTSYEKERNRLMKELRHQGDQFEAMGDVFATAKFNLKTKAGAAGNTPTHASVLAPSENVLQLEKQNATLGQKIKDIGGTFFKNAMSGLGRVADVLSRFGYALRTSAKGYADAYTSPDSAGGTKTTGWEAIRTFVNPILDLTPAGIISNIAHGDPKSYQNMWAGLSGKEKTSGSDVIKELYPEWTSNHKKWTSAIGFGTDVIYDPLTFITVGEGAVVSSAARASGSLAAKVAGRTALSESLMASTIFSKTGHAAGKEALEDYLRLKAIKPQTRALSKAERTLQSMQKKYDKAAPPKQAAMQPALSRSQAAKDLAKQHLDDAIDKTMDDSFKGIQLARKAIFNRTLGMGSWDAYTKGVRQGGLKTATALKYERTAEAFKAKVKEDWRTGTGSTTMRRYHAALVGETIKYGGKTKLKAYTVPEDFDDFVDHVAEIIMPHTPIRELTRSQLKRRYGIVNAKEAEAKQFFTELKFHAREKYKDGERPFPDAPEGGGASGGGGSSPDAGGGGGGSSSSPTPPSTRVTISTTADEDVANIVNNSARQAETNQAAFDNMSDAEKAYAQKFGYEPSVMSYRLFAQHLLDTGDEAGSNILEGFKSDLESGFRQAKGEGRFKQGRSDVGFQVDKEGLTEVKPWNNRRGGEDSARYDRPRNQEIAKVISEAWGTAQAKLANDMLANDPVSVVNAMQGVVAHLLNQMTADTHMQVAQFMSSKYGLSFLPMAPNRAVIHPGGLRGAIQRVSDLLGFVQRGVKSKPSLSEPNVKGFDLYKSLNEKLEIDLKEAIDKLDDPTSPFDMASAAVDWNSRGIALGFADTPIGYRVLDLYQGSANLQSPAIAPGGSLQMPTVNDAVVTILQKGEELIDALHFTHDESISKYSVLDHWIYGDNAAKEMKIGEHGIGRMAHIEKIEAADQDILANLHETIPNMDEDLLSAMRVVKAQLANHGGEVSPLMQRDLKEFMQFILAPDFSRLHTRFDGTPSAVPVAERAMETLGWHLDTLVSTTVRRGPSVGVRAAMAREIWSTPILMKELNQSIMLGTLHQVFVKKKSMEQAADELAALVAKYPLVQDLMKGAHEQGVANGTNGMRASINTVNDTPAPTNVPAPATVEATPDASNIHTPADETSATDPNPAAESSKPSPKTEAEGDEAATSAPNPPGGFTTPDIDPDASAAAAKLIEDIQNNVDLGGIQKVMDDAESSFTSAMAEYSAAMEQEFKDFTIRTGKVIRFMGMPIMPLPTIMNPMHSYAGVIGLKEHQSRVGNWLEKAWPKESESRIKAQMNLRRPSKALDGVINDIRRSVSNNAQERLTATHKIIRESYLRFKNRADRQSDTRLYFTTGKSMPDRFTEIQERLDMIGRSITHDADGRERSERVQRLYGQMFNRALPKKYQLPEEVFDPQKFLSKQKPFSREWLIRVSEFLETQSEWSQHVLTAGNLKTRLHMGNYEFALQHALSKLELSKDMHTSMFDNFTFHMPAERVKELNKNLKHEDHFVPLEDYYSADLDKYVNKEFKGRYVRRGIAEEMGKVTRFVEMQNQFRKSDFNFGVMTKINNYWKSVVTNWNIPKYHIGNIMADGFLNAMDGVRPEAYRKAATVMTHSHPLSGRISKDPEGYQILMRPDMTMDPGNIDREMREVADPKRAANVSTVMINGKPTRLDSEMIIKLYHDYGLGQTQVNGNLLRSSAMGSTKASEFYTKTSDYVLDLSNGREDYFRLAHFIHALESESKIGRRSLDEISIAARDRVIKYHFDYGDVTEFERLAVARYLPFYKWQRNILPLALGQMFVNPRVYTIGNSANQAMGEMMFPTQVDANGNEIPISYITPDFVGDSNMVPIGKYTDTNGNEQARYAVLNLPLEQALVTWLMPFVSPFMDQNLSGKDQASEGVRSTASTIMSKANPFIVAIQQAGLGKTAVTGDSFEAGPMDWLRTLGNVAAPDSGAFLEYLESTRKGEAQKTLGDTLGLIRERKSTEGIQRGTLHQENDKMTAVYAKAAAKWMKQNYPGVDPRSEEGKKILHDYFVSTGTLQR